MVRMSDVMPFGKHPRQLVRDARWFNSGPPPELVRDHAVTPTELFFTRNHAAVPPVDPESYRLTVDGLVERSLSLSLEHLRRSYPVTTVPATIACAGLRRDELMRIRPIPGEVAWGAEPISNGVWRGVRLARVLETAGIRPEAEHAQFTGLDDVEREGKRFGFGASIPVSKAMAEETLLAWEMNGEPLPPVHGFPLRVVVPGYIGARSVKWLTNIHLQTAPTENYFQSHAYRMFPPDVDASTVVWDQGVALSDVPLNSVIWSPQADAQLLQGRVMVSGWACASGGRTIERVEVTSDQGKQWHRAQLSNSGNPWSWTLWQVELTLTAGPHVLTARAWDSAGNTQPESPAPIWNFKGYMNNAWHRVPVTVEGPATR
jgi:sulfite oxidase